MAAEAPQEPLLALAAVPAEPEALLQAAAVAQLRAIAARERRAVRPLLVRAGSHPARWAQEASRLVLAARLSIPQLAAKRAR